MSAKKRSKSADGSGGLNVVAGAVTYSGDRRASGLSVVAYDQDLRSRQLLGRATTDRNGRYSIGYALKDYSSAETGTADVVVQVFSGLDELLFESAVQFDAPPLLTLNVSVQDPGAESEFERLLREVAPLLSGQDVALDSLEESSDHQDLTFISGETGIALDLWTDFEVSQRLATATHLNASFWYAALATHSISRGDVSGTAPSMFAYANDVQSRIPVTPAATVRAGILRGLAKNLIANSHKKDVDQWMRAYQALQTQAAKAPGALGNAAAIISAAGVKEEQSGAFLSGYLQGGSRADILAAIQATKAFTDAEMTRIGTTLAVNDLVLGDATLLGAAVQNASDGGAQALGRMGQADWAQFLSRTKSVPPDFVAGVTTEKKQANYASLLSMRVGLSYPTAAFAGALSRALKSGTVLPYAQAREVSSFLDQHTDFELGWTSIDGYLKKSTRSSAKTAASQAAMVQELKATQRLFKLAPNFDAVTQMRTDGLHSAQQVYRLGETQFVKRYAARAGFTQQSATDAYRRAANTVAAVGTLVGELRSTQSANLIPSTANPVAALDSLPNLASLFGKSDICECEDCRSIFSPAAYLADLLKWLEGRTIAPVIAPNTPGNPTPYTLSSAKDVLLARRPDIGYIELSCDNSTTELPYTDLACEVLEDRVASWQSFTLPLSIAPSLAAGAVSAPLSAAFAGAPTPITLDPSAKVYGPDHFGSWIVRDPNRSFLIANIVTAYTVTLLRQTRLTQDELLAYPDPSGVNQAAYTVLRAQTFPLSLPFDLTTEEVRAYLSSVNVKRAELMRVFRGAAAPNNPTDLDIASEAVGIGSYEEALIFSADPGNQAKYWSPNPNPTNAAVLADVSEVDVFLDRTGLEYVDLQKLLSLSFVNPGNAIVIFHKDSSCDTAQKQLQGLDLNGLDRLHRFLRLWRKLGWQMWEVDVAISALGHGTLDNNLGVALRPFAGLLKRFPSLNVETLCAFFAPISTRAKFTASFKTPDPSLYDLLFQNKQLTHPLDPAYASASVTAGGPQPQIDLDPAPVLAATRLGLVDLDRLETLTNPATQTPYIDGTRTLQNLSFLHRHARLASLLGVRINDWVTLLQLTRSNPFQRATDTDLNPSALFEFLKFYDRIRRSGFSIDQLDYLLTVDPLAQSALPDTTAAATLTPLQGTLRSIATTYDPVQIPNTINGLTDAIATQLQTLGWSAAPVQDVVGVLTNQIQLSSVSTATSPAAMPAGVPISLNNTTHTVSFAGVMTANQKAQLLGLADWGAYADAINELYDLPRLLIKFCTPSFSAPLKQLPASVQFSKLSSVVAANIEYDGDAQVLSYFGILSLEDLKALKALSTDGSYQTAAQALYDQPRTQTPNWMAATDIAFPLAPDPAADPTSAAAQAASANEIANITLAEQRLVTFARRKLSTDQVVQQFSAALGCTQATVSALITNYALFGTGPRNILEEFLDLAFVNADAAISAVTFPSLFVDYRWLFRAALIVKTFAIADQDLPWVTSATTIASSNTFDLAKLPLKPPAPSSALSLVPALINLGEFLSLHHTYSTGDTSLLAMVTRLTTDVTYTNALFAADVEKITAWSASDVTTLTTANTLAVAYPAGYQQIEAWQRLQEAFTMLGSMNASAGQALLLAAPALASTTSDILKGCLQAQYDHATWLANSKTIQDTLRGRKQACLGTYLLTQPVPSNVPNAKWDNLNDLLGYLLIDVQMCACQPSTRVLQGYLAAQLFVNRCFWGAEPQVRVSVEQDSGWNEWQWRESFRLRQAALEVFCYPENYAEPELLTTKSELFQTLENTLLQKEVTNDNVQDAFESYLEGLDDIAQLEICGSYHQISTQTLHVVGRSAGATPQTYYYRQFVNSLRWTAWSKIDLDVKGDYLTVFVADERIYIAWIEFQDMNSNSSPSQNSISVPIPSQNQASVNANDPPAQKRKAAYLAISEYRNQKWTPKKLSQEPFGSEPYTGDYDDERFVIVPLDLLWVPGALYPPGTQKPNLPSYMKWVTDGAFVILVYERPVPFSGYNMPATYWLELAGCRGYPDEFAGTIRISPVFTSFSESEIDYGHNVETDSPDENSTLTEDPATAWFFRTTILNAIPSAFKIAYPHYLAWLDQVVVFEQIFFEYLGYLQNPSERSAVGLFNGVPTALGTWADWFYADRRRTFHVRPGLYIPNTGLWYFNENILTGIAALLELIATEKRSEFMEASISHIGADGGFKLQFSTFYHPLTCLFIKQLYQYGVQGLLSRNTQLAKGDLDFNAEYKPTPIVDYRYAIETVTFNPLAGYSIYNWELFYFAPLMIAERLLQNQQFEDAAKWFHFIFDPSGANLTDPNTGATIDAPQKYWITKPFYERQSPAYEQQRIDSIMTLLADDPSNPTPPAILADLNNQVVQWQADPFDPHLIAQFRTVAYQKLTVMRYLDLLIAWGDQQFRLDTLESVTTALQLYVEALQILGPQPRVVPPAALPVSVTFNELDDQLDALANEVVGFENLIPPMPVNGGGTMPAPQVPSMLYFCIPPNDQLAQYWTTVNDRLYKIRHCLNIDGVFSPAVLFPPPINPMDLIRALAAGGNLSTALSNLYAPLPNYRYSTMLQKALEFTNDVQTLGASLLAALEKKDGESLASLRQGQEIELLQAVRNVKQQQIDDANLVIAGLQKGQDLITIRRDYYASREFMNSGETAAMGLSGASLVLDAAIAVGYVLSGGLKLVPDFVVGVAGFGASPTATVKTGGASFGSSAEDAVRTLQSIGASLDKAASIASTVAGYQRRQDDWQFQVNAANKELEQIAQQLASAQQKLLIAQTELTNHDLQIKHSQSVNDFMHSKYTNYDLYQWMTTQISQSYFQSYGLALDLARSAEQCYRYELGVESSGYIQGAYWNSLRSGLQAGDGLKLSLRELDSAYLAANQREREVSKNVSLALIAPQALLQLKDAGICSFDLPEELWDLDFPGHYFRRIKSVSLTIPHISGPYTSANATLRLIKNSIRINSSPGAQYEHNNDDGVLTDDDRFRQGNTRVTSIAASSAQNDSGLFELNFRDERYLPFEGAGVISSWQLELMQERSLRSFSYESISDAILHIVYTSREDSGPFKMSAIQHLKDVVLAAGGSGMTQWRFFDLRHEFPTEWYAFMNPPLGGVQSLQLKITQDHFAFLAQDKKVQLVSAAMVARFSGTTDYYAQINPPFVDTGTAPIKLSLATPASLYRSGVYGTNAPVQFMDPQNWTIQLGKTVAKMGGLATGDILECYLIVGYTLTVS